MISMHSYSRLRNILCAAGLLATALSVSAAGFNCSGANLTSSEAAICSDDYLSGSDNVLNKLFSAALENSINRGTLYRQQRQWVRERNQCGDDIACLKQKYIERNKQLAVANPFSHIDEAFIRDGDQLDPPVAENLKNKNGFIITEDRWRVKLIVPDFVFSSAEFSAGDRQWQVLTHRIVNGDLVIYFVVSGTMNDEHTSYVVRVDEVSRPQIVARYTYARSGDLTIKQQPGSKDTVTYSVSRRPDPETEDSDTYTEETYQLNVVDDAVKKINSATYPNVPDKENKWVGYCETQACTSRVTSPDGKWRLASTDNSFNQKDEGMYYFPAAHPDQGVNVFLAQGDTIIENGFSYDRSYVWGDENTFYFDNDGGYACIWRTDIKNKLTQRILPLERMLNPYYLKYDNEEMVIAFYSRYSEKNKKTYNEIYLAKK